MACQGGSVHHNRSLRASAGRSWNSETIGLHLCLVRNHLSEDFWGSILQLVCNALASCSLTDLPDGAVNKAAWHTDFFPHPPP